MSLLNANFYLTGVRGLASLHGPGVHAVICPHHVHIVLDHACNATIDEHGTLITDLTEGAVYI